MNDRLNLDGLPEHHEMSALITWYVNDTLDDRQRKRLQAHLVHCPACRTDLELERRIYDSMTTDAGVEYMPGPSLKRLQARLNALPLPAENSAAADREVHEMPSGSPAAGQAEPRRTRWIAIAASAAVIGLALGVVMIDRELRITTPTAYRTVTTSTPRVPAEVVRAVFAPTITLVDLQSLLDEAQLRIVAGPTEAGVYSLAATSKQPITASLETLRKHPAVRFAESTVPRSPEP